jgi:2-methylcitrate dehydratase
MSTSPNTLAQNNTMACKMAHFISHASEVILTAEVLETLKIRLLDALGCALGAIDAPPVRMVAKYVQEAGGNPLCSVIGGRAHV